MRSLSTIGSLAPEFNNFKPKESEETKIAERRIKPKPHSMPIRKSATMQLNDFVTVDETNVSYDGQMLRKVEKQGDL